MHPSPDRQLTSHPPAAAVESGRAMNPEPAELIQRLRQQHILAQVRIMELEDARDEAAPRLADADRLVAAAQVLADQKVDEAGHLEKVRADLQAQFEHMRHMQHVTNEALNAARTDLAATQQSLATAREAQDGLLLQLGRAQEELLALEHSLRAAQADARDRAARVAQLDAEQRLMKSSRSWRWTAWLRALERSFGGRR